MHWCVGKAMSAFFLKRKKKDTIRFIFQNTNYPA